MRPLLAAFLLTLAACGSDEPFAPNDYFDRYPMCQADLLRCVETQSGPACLVPLCQVERSWCATVCTERECAPACEHERAAGRVSDCSDPCRAIQ